MLILFSKVYDSMKYWVNLIAIVMEYWQKKLIIY